MGTPCSLRPDHAPRHLPGTRPGHRSRAHHRSGGAADHARLGGGGRRCSAGRAGGRGRPQRRRGAALAGVTGRGTGGRPRGDRHPRRRLRGGAPAAGRPGPPAADAGAERADPDRGAGGGGHRRRQPRPEAGLRDRAGRPDLAVVHAPPPGRAQTRGPPGPPLDGLDTRIRLLAMPRKLVLVVVDAMHPEMLMRAIDEEVAPTFAALVERGEVVTDVVSSFPSVTPVASSEMMTGLGPAGHWVMGMNWYHRLERRYIEYGSSFEATRTFGLFRAMYDLVYNMNLDHLSWQAQTVFELLGDAGIRTAATPFLIYRGRQRHQLGLEGLVKRAAAVANFRHAVWGPDEFFYGDLYASRPTGCGPSFTRPGTRDEYSACVAENLVAEGAYDFLLFSLPDNDFHSHRHGPEAQVDSIARADAAFARIVEAGGGLDAFLS